MSVLESDWRRRRADAEATTAGGSAGGAGASAGPGASAADPAAEVGSVSVPTGVAGGSGTSDRLRRAIGRLR